MTIDNTQDDFLFTYDSVRPYNENFTNWRLKNSAERSAYSEQQLAPGEAETIFDKLFGQYK
tara:strand:- start:272 stop:454 length:183 start_codon:yes stop_codon:yes gene_type:complete